MRAAERLSWSSDAQVYERLRLSKDQAGGEQPLLPAGVLVHASGQAVTQFNHAGDIDFDRRSAAPAAAPPSVQVYEHVVSRLQYAHRLNVPVWNQREEFLGCAWARHSPRLLQFAQRSMEALAA
jgi:hypothetical protein